MGRAAGPAGAEITTRWNRIYLGLYLAYIALGLALRWNGWLAYDHIWFIDAARHLLAGSWHIYDFKPADPAVIGIAPPLGLAYSYSPLTALLMVPCVALADALGGSAWAAGVGGADGLAARLIVVPLLIADVLAMEQLRRLVRAWRPAVDEVALFLGVLPTLLVTGFLYVSANRDHQEGLVLLLLLTTLRVTPRHLVLGGILAGLTLAAKQTAVLELLPVGAVLLLNGMRRPAAQHPGAPPARPARPADGWIWGGLAAGVFGTFLLPPLLADRDAVVYAFLTQEQRRVISGQGLPAWIDAALAAGLGPGSADYARWHGWIVASSNVVLVLAGIGLVGGVLWWNARRGRPVGLVDSRLLALVALGGLLQIVLAKWVTGHYYQLPLALVLLWDTVRASPRWPWLGLGGTLGFRVITVSVNLPAVPQVKDGLLFALFAGLAGAALAGACGPDRPVPLDPQPGAPVVDRVAATT